jgi:hypothetical protein
LVVPLGSPGRAELWQQRQLALSLLDHRGPTAETAALVRRVLLGESIERLSTPSVVPVE